MHISDKTFLAMVEMHESISPENLKALQVEGESSRQPLQTLAIKKRLISDKQLTRLFSEYANIPYIEIDPKEISIDAVNILPEYIARQYNSIVFRIDETGLVHLAMEDPDDVEALSFIQKQVGSNTKVYVCTRENISNAIDSVYSTDVDKELGEMIKVIKMRMKLYEKKMYQKIHQLLKPLIYCLNMLSAQGLVIYI